MPDNPFLDELALRWEDEGFAARDIDGQLVRRVDAEERDYGIFVDVTVDGLPPVKVRNADYLKDSQGNIVRDDEGRGVLRYTTIYDAVRQVYGDRVRQEHIVPTLCPLDVSPYDFSTSHYLIRRTAASTRRWLSHGGLSRRSSPQELQAHRH